MLRILPPKILKTPLFILQHRVAIPLNEQQADRAAIDKRRVPAQINTIQEMIRPLPTSTILNFICDTSIDKHNPGVIRPLSMSVINNIKFYICDTSIDKHNPGGDQVCVYLCN